MAESKLKIEIFRNKNMDELTRLLSSPEEKIGAGSGAAAVASIAAAFLHRACVLSFQDEERSEEQEWLIRNAEILRSYMVNLIDEDVKCHGPLRRAMKEGDERNIEAAMQTAVSICAEIVNMMEKALELGERLAPHCQGEASAYLEQSAILALSAARAAVPHILYMGSYSTDETYRFVLSRENEITLSRMEESYERVLSHRAYNLARNKARKRAWNRSGACWIRQSATSIPSVWQMWWIF